MIRYSVYNYTDYLHGSTYTHKTNRYARCHLRPCRACYVPDGQFPMHLDRNAENAKKASGDRPTDLQTNQPTDRLTDRPTDLAGCRVANTQKKPHSFDWSSVAMHQIHTA